MRGRLTARFLCGAVVSTGALPSLGVASAPAQPCPDVQVVFARGTGEPPGVGPTGQAFVDSLRPRLGARSLDVYPVNYPASEEWATGLDGIRDAGAHVVSMANTCPNTKMVLGGYSQGAAVTGFVTSASVPDGVDPATVPKPLDPKIADHVAAVVLFAMPNVRAMNFLGQPPVVIGPAYQAKTIKLCAPEDPVCSDGMNFAAHDSYAGDGAMIDRGAAFAANHLGPPPPPGQSPPSVPVPAPAPPPPPPADDQEPGA
ncbi:cutinase family protein [Mycobacterium branderi]|uniref:Cutinase family protein n=1 Tax=Mycobacterium branderi TaxID=43348 RepID=A0AA91LVL5_9MYCO|nr:cutinase family protein [Mycobacterium branderi]MCV7234481.1 cutinase family protein [Mycobacterium branderi]ORA34095.1 cutinase family protein [Mycobacterium branderi]